MNSIKAILAGKGRKAKSMNVGDTVSVEPDSNALMHLVIEKTNERKLSVGHYYSQAGDLMRDPEVVFQIENGDWTPIRFTQDPNIQRYNSEGLNLGSFLAKWNRNLRQQGYVDTTQE